MKPLKETLYTRAILEALANAVAAEHSAFDKEAFLKQVFSRGWKTLELKQRMRRVTTALHDVLDLPYRKAAVVLGRTARHGQGFAYLSFPDYIEVYGQDDLESSLPALKATTVACSSEFAVRPFLMAHPKRMLTEMLTWAADADERVRRLASEGSRPRLPWGMALPAMKEDPTPALPILEALKNDPSPAVRRSVANHLNDISKDNPQVFLGVARRWMRQTPETDALLKHAARTLLKRGDPDTIALFGFGGSEARVRRLKLSSSPVPIGGELTYTFDVEVTNPSRVRIECVMYYLKKSGRHNRKTFKICEGMIKEKRSFGRRLSFRDLSTRKHYAGEHFLSIMVNGKESRRKRFEVCS